MLNWFYSFFLNKLSLICFCKKKKRVWKYRSTQPDPIDPFKNDPFWPMTHLTVNPIDRPDPTRPFCHVSSQNQMLWEFSNFLYVPFLGMSWEISLTFSYFLVPPPQKKKPEISFGNHQILKHNYNTHFRKGGFLKGVTYSKFDRYNIR